MSRLWQKLIHTKSFDWIWQRWMAGLDYSLSLKRLFYRLVWALPASMRPPNKVREALRTIANRKKGVFFLHIGANDGLTDDSIAEYIMKNKWQGIMVEPVPHVFERLRKTYGNISWVHLENSAVSEKTEIRQFWCLKKGDNLPHGYDTIGSFDKQHLMAFLEKTPALKPYLTACEVPCLRLDDLLNKYDVKCVDVMSVDTEGYDGQIIRQINFSRIRPDVIVYESLHLGSDEQEQCCRLLAANGYEVVEDGGNTVARLMP